MKKILLLLISVTIMQLANAQESFHKHALVISADWGGDGYSLNETYTFYSIFGPVSQDKNGRAVNSNFSGSAEFGLLRWLGIGLQCKVDNYIIGKDSSGFQPKAVGGELGVLVNLHLVRTHHVDFCMGFVAGGSSFTYTVDKNNDIVYGTGGWGDFHATFRYYFGRFGLNTSLYLPTMNFPNLSSNNVSWSLGQSVLAAWAAKGVGINIGIQYRFLNPPGSK